MSGYFINSGTRIQGRSYKQQQQQKVKGNQ